MFINRHEILKLIKNLGEKGVHAKLLSNGRPEPYVGQKGIITEAIIRLFCAYQSNILLTGRAGIGKTSFVKEVANTLLESPISSACSYYVIEVSIGSILSGTGMRGDFEKKVGDAISLISEYENIVVFCDEAHMMRLTASDGGIGMMDLLKPVLLNANTKFILATTDDEKDLFSSDPAFVRRFHSIELAELTESEKRQAVESHFENLANFHGIKDFFLDQMDLDFKEPLHQLINTIDFSLAKKRIIGNVI
ncbi:AAA family ATPase [Saccharospirillum impatiens]|uniref:AAA family ATPase n=1 Tax=Saccharospirillum impatiens TaxID=169438 RepID=UPI00048D122C|nr:AAA family ATPase [Saccharospirillum impatiens]